MCCCSSLILPGIHAWLQDDDALHMMSHGEGIESPQGPYAVARVPRVGDVPRQRSRVARDVGDSARSHGRDVLDDGLASTGARRVENDQVSVDSLSYQRFQDTVDLAAAELDLAVQSQVDL